MTPEKEAVFTMLNNSLSLATLVGTIVLLVWVVDLSLVSFGIIKAKRYIYKKIGEYALPFGFFATLLSTLVSLYYSDILGVLPCGLCWFQRVFIYSITFILGFAWWKKDSHVWRYVQVLSIPGALIALYHEYLQLGYSEFIPCPAIASTVDCAKPTFLEYGFVTYPFMSFVLFVFLLILSFVVRKGQTN